MTVATKQDVQALVDYVAANFTALQARMGGTNLRRAVADLVEVKCPTSAILGEVFLQLGGARSELYAELEAIAKDAAEKVRALTGMD